MNVKLDSFQTEPDTIVGKLRSHLKTLEDKIYFLTQQEQGFILDYLAEMDAAWCLYETLRADNEVGEILRFRTLQKQVLAKASPLLRILGGSDGLKLVRPADASPTEQPWWFVDQHVARRRAQLWKQAVKLGGVLAAVVLVVVILFNTLLKPDPAVLLRLQHYNEALALAAENQDYNGALLEIEQALAVAPNDPELLILKGVVLTQLDRTDEAAPLFEQATDLTVEPEQVLVLRGRFLAQMNAPESALALAQEASAMNPEYAEAWFLAGQVYADLGLHTLAYDSLSQAANLALAQDKSELYVMAKTNLAYLGQGSGLGP
jgi:tetratricopeptide (TPR) repeat protein